MSCGQIVFGASCEDRINYGETIDLTFRYQDETGAPIDLSSATVAVFSSTPDIIKSAAEVTIPAPLDGEVRFLLRRDDALKLKIGAGNKFRLQAIFSADSDDVTPDIYLEIS